VEVLEVLQEEAWNEREPERAAPPKRKKRKKKGRKRRG
jgi:hypothetical protein